MKTQTPYQMPKYFVLILAMLTSISPLAIDVYLPSFTQMSDYFYTSIDQIEITLSIYLLGFGLGQLLGGPLSDRYGRKLFIFCGLALYISFSLLISYAHSVQELWIFRFFQAIGGGFAVVNTSAIVRDLFEGKEAAKVFSIISMIMMVAPMVAPIIGITILKFFSWDYIFLFLSFYALALSYFISMLPETSPKTKNSKMFENYLEILKKRKSLFLMLANGFGFSGLFIFITKSSFIYMKHFELDNFYFGLFFSLNVASLMINSRLNIKFLDKFDAFSIFYRGVIVQLAAALALLLLSLAFNIPVLVVVAGFMLYIGTLGYVFGNSMSLLLQNYKTQSATATALNGVIGFLISSFMGFLSSLFHSDSLTPIFALMCVTSFISFVFLNLYKLSK